MNRTLDKLLRGPCTCTAGICLLLCLAAADAHALTKIHKWFPGRCEGRIKHGAKVTVAVTNGWVIFNGANPRTHIQFTTLRNVNLLVNTADKLSFKRSPKQRGGIVSNLWFGTSASLMKQTNDLVYTGSDVLNVLFDYVDVRSVRARAVHWVKLGALHDEMAGGCLSGLHLDVRDVIGGASSSARLRLGLPGFFTPVVQVQSKTRIEWVDARQMLPPQTQRNARVLWQSHYYALGDILVRDDQRDLHQGKNVVLVYRAD